MSDFRLNTLYSVDQAEFQGHLAFEQARLSNTAAKAVKKLLPKSANNDLASKCSWADHVRFIYPWSSALHFADTPDSVCSYQNKSKILSPSPIMVAAACNMW